MVKFKIKICIDLTQLVIYQKESSAKCEKRMHTAGQIAAGIIAVISI